MGTLRDLKAMDKNVHLLVTNSNLADIYVYDTLKERCDATLESIYNIEKVSDIGIMKELVGMEPYMSDRWLFIVDYSKLKKSIKEISGIFEADTSIFLIKVKGYADFKEFKELYPRCNDVYLSMIRRNDILYLFNDIKISSKCLDFVCKSYMREPEKVFMLRKEMLNGYEVSKDHDIIKLCGASSGSVVSFALGLLSSNPKSKKGFDMVMRNKVLQTEDMIDAYGIRSFRNFLVSSVRDIMDIKILYLQGVIYNSIRDLPEIYDERKLSRYNYCLGKIIETQYDDIMRLYLILKSSGMWIAKSDVMSFLYNYYGGKLDVNSSEL